MMTCPRHRQCLFLMMKNWAPVLTTTSPTRRRTIRHPASARLLWCCRNLPWPPNWWTGEHWRLLQCPRLWQPQCPAQLHQQMIWNPSNVETAGSPSVTKSTSKCICEARSTSWSWNVSANCPSVIILYSNIASMVFMFSMLICQECTRKWRELGQTSTRLMVLTARIHWKVYRWDILECCPKCLYGHIIVDYFAANCS